MICSLRYNDPVMTEMLEATRDQLLIKGNQWGDAFWSVSTKTGKGENHLGSILMKKRGTIK